MSFIKQPKFVGDSQDLYDRRVLVVRPREALRRLSQQHDWPVDDSPKVAMTEEAPFEGQLEGGRAATIVKLKEAYLREFGLEEFPLPPPPGLFEDRSTIEEFFDKWWIAEEAGGYLEIVAGSWKY